MTHGTQWIFPFDTAYFTNATGLNLTTPVTAQTGPYYIYALDSATSTRNMPFNRVDYYLDTAGVPSSCTGTFTLYRATYNPDGSSDSKMPIIDCVKDFQVAFNVNGSGWQSTISPTDSPKVHEVRAFVLLREGTGDTGKDPSFRFSGTLYLGDQDTSGNATFQQLSSNAIAGALNGGGFTPTGKDAQYRWKILQIAVKPMNLR
jgi:hypothetical protein